MRPGVAQTQQARRIDIGRLTHILAGTTLLGTLLSAPLFYAALLLLMLPLAEASLALFAALHEALLLDTRLIATPLDPLYSGPMIRDAGRFFSVGRAAQALWLAVPILLFVSVLPAIFKPRSWTGLLLSLLWSLVPILLALSVLAPDLLGSFGQAISAAIVLASEPLRQFSSGAGGVPLLLVLAFLPATVASIVAVLANAIAAVRQPDYRRALRGAVFLAPARRVHPRGAVVALLRAAGRVALAATVILLVNCLFLFLLTGVWPDGSFVIATPLAEWLGGEGTLVWMWVLLALLVVICLVVLALIALAGRLLLGRWALGWDALCLMVGLIVMMALEGATLLNSAGFLLGFPGLFLLVAGRSLLFRAIARAGALARRDMQAEPRTLSGRYRRWPALYLRPFAEDWRVLRDLRDRVVSLLLARPLPRRLEEIIADSVFRRRPLVALGNPAEGGLAGAAKTYVADEAWRATVEELIGGSDVVILVVGSTPNIRWEAERIQQAGRLSQTIFVVPAAGAALDGFIANNPEVATAFALPGLADRARLLLFYVDTQGRPTLLMSGTRSVTAYELALDIATSAVGTAAD